MSLPGKEFVKGMALSIFISSVYSHLIYFKKAYLFLETLLFSILFI
jgi:hypothetical protein